MEPQARNGPAGDELEGLHGPQGLVFVDQRVYDYGLPVTREALHQFESGGRKFKQIGWSLGTKGGVQKPRRRGSDAIVAAVRVAEAHNKGPCAPAGRRAVSRDWSRNAQIEEGDSTKSIIASCEEDRQRPRTLKLVRQIARGCPGWHFTHLRGFVAALALGGSSATAVHVRRVEALLVTSLSQSTLRLDASRRLAARRDRRRGQPVLSTPWIDWQELRKVVAETSRKGGSAAARRPSQQL
jgi:hypothetical protein